VSQLLGEILARVAVEVLKWWGERQAIRNEVRAKLALEASELARKALEWKEDHPVVLGPDPLGDFRVQPGGKHLPTDRA
jgi:hypothetical protein